MNKKLCTIALIGFSWMKVVYSEPILCPPGNAVYCDEGICTVDPLYSNWRLFVTGNPSGYGFFILASIKTTPQSKAICQYGAANGNTRKRFFTLHSPVSYSADTTIPGNRWDSYDNGEHLTCLTENNPSACPMKLPQE